MFVHYRCRLTLLVLLLLSLPFYVLQVAARQFDNGKRTVVVGSEYNYPPFSFLNSQGEPDGFNIDLVRAVAKEVGFDLEIRMGPWGEIRTRLETGRLNAVVGVFYSPERDRNLDFSQPFFEVHQSFFRRAGGVEIGTLADLNESRILVMRGDIMHDYLLSAGLAENLITAETIEDMMLSFAAGVADYAAAASLPATTFLKEQGIEGIVPAGITAESAEYCFAVVDGDRALLSDLIEGLSILKVNGEYRRIQTKWFGLVDDRSAGLKNALIYSAYVLMPLAAVALLALAWGLAMRRAVGRKTVELRQEILRRGSAESDYAQVNRVLEAIRRVHQLIVRSENRDSMLDAVCAVLTTTRGYKSAWVALFEEDGSFQTAYESGLDEGFGAVLGHLERGILPPCATFSGESNLPQLTDAADEICRDCPLMPDHTRHRGITVPLVFGRRRYGYLFVVVPNSSFQDEVEQELLVGIGADIAYALHDLELQQEQEAMSRTLSRATTIVRNSRIVLFRWENQEGWPVSYVSENVRRFGYEAEEFLKGEIGFDEIIHQEDRSRIVSEVDEAIDSGSENLVQEYRILDRRGKAHWIEDRTRFVRDNDGRVIAMEGIVFDITERRLAEEELRFQSLLLNQISDKITATDLDGRVTYVNEAECSFFGLPREELVGRNAAQYGDDTLNGPTHDEIIETVRREGTFNGDMVNINAAGKKLIVAARIQRLHDSQGREIGMVGIGRDITEIRAADERFRQQDARLRAIIESAEDMIYLKNHDLVYTHVNSAFADFMRKEPSELIGAVDSELFDADEANRIIEVDSRVLQGETHRGESSRMRVGEERRIETIKVPVRDEAGEIIGICAISRDITLAVKVRQELESALEEKNVLLRELYHRTKNNMQVIASIVALRRFGLDDELQQAVLLDIEGKIHSMALVHKRLYQTKDLSRLDLKDYIEELADLIQSTFEDKTRNIRFRFDLESAAGLIDTAVPLGLVLNELIVNAVKHAFIGRQSGAIDIRMRSVSGGGIELTLADDGIGLPNGFDPVRAESLGLQTVYSIVEGQLNGSLACTCRGGTQWTLKLGNVDYKERV